MFSQALNPNLLPLPSSDDLLLTPGRKSVVKQDTHMSTHPLGLGLPQSSLCGPPFIPLHPAPPPSQCNCDKSHLRRISKTSKMWLYAPYFFQPYFSLLSILVTWSLSHKLLHLLILPGPGMPPSPRLTLLHPILCSTSVRPILLEKDLEKLFTIQ